MKYQDGFMIRLYALRRDHNLQQKDMANLLGISPQYYHDLENDRRKPSIRIATAVSAINRRLGLLKSETALSNKRLWHCLAAKANGWDV